MTKIKMGHDGNHPHRVNFTESKMSYAGKRIDNQIVGGGRDSKQTNSGPRLVMSVGFQNGELQLLTPTPRASLSGLEKDYLESDWGVFVSGTDKEKRIVLDVLENEAGFEDNILVTHADAVRPWEVSADVIPKMMKHHSKYAIDMVLKEGVKNKLVPGELLNAGERLTTTRSALPDGQYGNGREANCISISSFSTNEDTCAVLDTVPKDFVSVAIEDFNIVISNEMIPLNIHGNDDIYRCVPAVGAIIEDGILMATRPRNKMGYLAHRTKESLRKPRRPFDEIYYCHRGGEVISVEVIKSNSSKIMNDYIPERCNEYLDHLAARTQLYYRRILEMDTRYKRTHGDKYWRSPEWHILVRTAMTRLFGKPLTEYVRDIGKIKEVVGTIEDVPVRSYMVKIKVRHTVVPHLGHKFCDQHGAKYVISEIRDHDRMYKDQWGRVAEFATNGVANINRAIWGRLHEPYINDAKFHAVRVAKEINEREGVEAARAYLLEGIKVMSDKTYWMLMQVPEEARNRWLDYYMFEAPFLQLEDEIGDESLTITGLQKVRNSKYRPPRGKVRFTNARGVEVESVNDIRISSMYISANEKIGANYSASNIPLRQVSGGNRKLNSKDKKVNQVSISSNRVTSEADFRMIADACTPEEAKAIIRDGTSISMVNNAYAAVLNGDSVPDIDISNVESRGMEVFKSELLVDGVYLRNTKR